MENTLLVIITALCSGLIATLVTIWWQENHQKKMDKNKIFAVLMSKRYDFIAEESVDALNMIDVVFYNSNKVRKAWQDFNDATLLPDSPTRAQTISDKHLKLLETIAEDIGYKNIRWDDIKQYYYPNGLLDRKKEETVLRRVQIDAGIAQLQRGEEKEQTSQTNKNDELAGQVLLEMMKNPDGLLKLMDVAEKAQKFQKK